MKSGFEWWLGTCGNELKAPMTSFTPTSLMALTLRRFNSPAHQARWKQIEKEIQVTGGYQLNDSELIFGAKTAWRNSARCIGRIQWSKLQVNNFRSMTSYNCKNFIKLIEMFRIASLPPESSSELSREEKLWKEIEEKLSEKYLLTFLNHNNEEITCRKLIFKSFVVPPSGWGIWIAESKSIQNQSHFITLHNLTTCCWVEKMSSRRFLSKNEP